MGTQMSRQKRLFGKNDPIVEYWDDERNLGNGIIVTLLPGIFFYDDCGVMGFDTISEANAEIARVSKRYILASRPTLQP